MITEEEKYVSEVAKIVGIAFLSPLGRIFLDPFTFVKGHELMFVLSYFLYALALAFVGFAFFVKGRDILKANRSLK